MSTTMRFIGLSALALCMFVTGAFAQTITTGSIEGTVVDSNGEAIPGVAVTVSGPNLIRAQSATTNDAGSYRIPNIPPGKYTVAVAEDKGFAEFEQKNVRSESYPNRNRYDST